MKFPDHVRESRNIKAIATNSGKPWTEREVQIATAFIFGFSKRYQSIEEIATKIGRTYGAVRAIQAKARWANKHLELKGFKNEI